LIQPSALLLAEVPVLDETHNPPPRAPLTPAQRATPASIDLISLCRSLPADGHLSEQDLEVLKDWNARYRDIPLPAQEYISGVVDKALEKQVVTAVDRESMYAALEPALPVQLRKETQEQRLLAEIAAAEQEGGPFATISIDFLVAGVHVEGRWRTIQSRVVVGDVVRLVRKHSELSDAGAMSVVLADGQCIGLVPEEDARLMAQELDRGGRVEASVKKILNDGQFPVPVIGARVHCVASDDVELAGSVSTNPEPPARPRLRSQARPRPQSRGSKLALTLAVGLSGGVLIIWALLAR
jgi:hypothetical protein